MNSSHDINKWIDSVLDIPETTSDPTSAAEPQPIDNNFELIDLPDELLTSELAAPQDTPSENVPIIYSNPDKKRKRQDDELTQTIDKRNLEELKERIREMNVDPAVYCARNKMALGALFYRLTSNNLSYGEARYQHNSIIDIIDRIKVIIGPISQYKSFYKIDSEVTKLFSTSSRKIDALMIKWFDCSLRPLVNILRGMSDENYARLKEMSLGTFANPTHTPAELFNILKRLQKFKDKNVDNRDGQSIRPNPT